MHTLEPVVALNTSCRTSMSRTIIGPLVTRSDRRAAGGERLQRAAGELVVPFDRLIRIGCRAERRQLARPRRMIELASKHVDEVGLDENQRRKRVVRVELELRLVAAREAVVAGVRAAAIRIQASRRTASP